MAAESWQGLRWAGPARVAPAILAAALVACSRSPGTQQPDAPAPVYATSPGRPRPAPIRFAVHPLHNPVALARDYQPLMDYLNAAVPGRAFVLEASRDYADYERKIRERAPEFLLANPWQGLQAIKVGYRLIAQAGAREDFRGVFVTRRDSRIRTVADLRGRIVAYPAPTALAACIMPQWFLHTHGLDVGRDIVNRYVGSQESAIMNAYLGRAAVGVTWPPPWREFVRDHPAEAAQLRVIWTTDALVNNAILARDDVAPGLVDSTRRLLFGLERTARGRDVLAAMQTARVTPAVAADYEPVRRFVARFEAEVRPVEGR